MIPSAHRWSVHLPAEFGHADITPELERVVRDAGIRTGVLTVQMLGSTGAITTIEYESGALSDLRRALEAIAPTDGDYAHNARWGDGNGFSQRPLGAAQDQPRNTSCGWGARAGHLAAGRGDQPRQS